MIYCVVLTDNKVTPQIQINRQFLDDEDTDVNNWPLRSSKLDSLVVTLLPSMQQTGVWISGAVAYLH